VDALGGEGQIAPLVEIEITYIARGDVVGVAVDRGLVHQSVVIGPSARGPVSIGGPCQSKFA